MVIPILFQRAAEFEEDLYAFVNAAKASSRKLLSSSIQPTPTRDIYLYASISKDDL